MERHMALCWLQWVVAVLCALLSILFAYAYANDNDFEEQAAWTVEAYKMAKAWGWAGPMILWNLNFRVVADGTEKAQWGIVSNNWSPLPAYNALAGMPK